ncbi:hypothetical protein ACOMHN_006282 [Nucella lapillus]
MSVTLTKERKDKLKSDFYAFPPFSVTLQVLQKVCQEQSTGVLIVPSWKTQVWWPVLSKMLTAEPICLLSTKDVLILPSHPHKIHPLVKKGGICVFWYAEYKERFGEN